MAFGFTPHFATDLYLDQLTPQQFLALSVDLAGQMGWKIRFVSDTGFIALTTDKVFKWKAKVTLKITSDQATIRSESVGNEMTDWGKNRKVVEKFTNALYEQRNTVSPEDLSAKYEELKPELAPSEQDILTAAPETAGQKAAGMFSLFVPRKDYFITPILVDLNIAVFLLMALSGVSVIAPSSQTLINWGANVRFYTLNGGWWRLITCCFVHIGIVHLLFNMYALVYIGLLLEPLLGKLRFISAYLLAGIASSMTSLYWHDLTISVGASGAIFGMYGVFLAMLTTNFIDKSVRKSLLTSIGIFVGFNLLYSAKGGIDAAAHIGGLVSGLVIGYLFYPGLKAPARYGYPTIVIAALLVFTTSFIVFRRIPNDIVRYEKKMEAFAALEGSAIRLLNFSASAPESAAGWLRDSGIYYWNRNIDVLNEARQLNVPDVLKQRTDILIEYCNLRIGSLNWAYRQMIFKSNPGTDSADYYNSKIRAILNSFKSQ